MPLFLTDMDLYVKSIQVKKKGFHITLSHDLHNWDKNKL